MCIQSAPRRFHPIADGSYQELNDILKQFQDVSQLSVFTTLSRDINHDFQFARYLKKQNQRWRWKSHLMVSFGSFFVPVKLHFGVWQIKSKKLVFSAIFERTIYATFFCGVMCCQLMWCAGDCCQLSGPKSVVSRVFTTVFNLRSAHRETRVCVGIERSRAISSNHTYCKKELTYSHVSHCVVSCSVGPEFSSSKI